jgi:hypothetical protein
MKHLLSLLVVAALAPLVLGAQTKRPQAGASASKSGPAEVSCPSPLGEGIESSRLFCDVLIGMDPASGIIVRIPPRRGNATLFFDLHNRHTYSEDLIRTGRAYVSYTAVIGVLAPDGTLLSRAAIQSEFRQPGDLFDRVSGGAGPGGMKAVAPTGVESVAVLIPPNLNEVSILGEILTLVRPEAVENFTAQGRPIAVVSNVMLELTPAPAPAKPPVRRK